MSETLDIEPFRAWIGREEEAAETITQELVNRFRATFDETAIGPERENVAPLAIHWCLAPAALPTAELGPDGHPRRGGFLPPIPLPRRMWAGGEIVHHAAPRIGDRVLRLSRIEDVKMKQGQSGPLCFVTLRHEFRIEGQLAVQERQDIVYRGLERTRQGARANPVADTAPAPRWSATIEASPILLFRYSALTFNGHRIHYDRRYCLAEEGYPGLVVHGPLQATLLLHFAAKLRGGSPPKRFSFRSTAPIFDGGTFVLGAVEKGTALTIWTVDCAGRQAMTAEAAW